ncbi:MAG: hypothetical protein OEW48_07555 [Phycisphaerae bacterium]|nr:hypothetical protein [Phycisphaerae bacterium]
MRTRYKQSGRTLAEMTVVIAAIVLLGSFGLPAVRKFLDSFESGTGARPVISAALASARAVAAKEQRYAGIRFQKAYNSDGPLKANQYMVFIVNDFDKTGLVSGFRAVEGLNPIKLPDSVGVIDLSSIGADVDIDEPFELNNATAFSIIFSPSGKQVIHDVRVRNRDGHYQPLNLNESMDDIFNSPENIANFNTGMFVQDDYPSLGLGQEPSRRSFIIYDRLEFKRAYQQGQAYSGYLVKLVPEMIYINPYTGIMIEK